MVLQQSCSVVNIGYTELLPGMNVCTCTMNVKQGKNWLGSGVGSVSSAEFAKIKCVSVCVCEGGCSAFNSLP